MTLEVTGVTKRFGGLVAVDEVSLTVPGGGHVIGLMGPNGAGKTTLFNCITGYLRPDRGDVRLGGESITGAMLADCAAAQGTPVEPGTIVLVRTGWLSVYRGQGSGPFFKEEPGIGMNAARWLADRDAVAIGVDNFAVEVIPTESGIPAPVHRFLIRDCGMYLMELFDLNELAEAGVHEFLFVAAPLGIVGGLGSPLTPLAIA